MKDCTNRALQITLIYLMNTNLITIHVYKMV